MESARLEVAKLEQQIAAIAKDKDRSKDDKESASKTLKAEIETIVSQTPDYHAPTVSGVKEAALYVLAAEGRHGKEQLLACCTGFALMPRPRGPPNARQSACPA